MSNSITMTQEQLQAIIQQGVAAALNAQRTTIATITPQEETKMENQEGTGDTVKYYARQAAFVSADVIAASGIGTRVGLDWVADRIKDTGAIIEGITCWTANVIDNSLNRTPEELNTELNRIMDKFRKPEEQEIIDVK